MPSPQFEGPSPLGNRTNIKRFFLSLLGALSILLPGTMEVIHSSSATPPMPKMGETRDILSDPASPADSSLIHSTEWHWHRYLKNALNLPDWLDLGLEHRTRFETYDHPWRTSQSLGRTDPQIQQRSRLRIGMSGGPFKVLLEGQDSRVHLDDPGDFVNTGIRNEMDILQAMASLTLKNVFGAGLLTALHIGRLTMDFGGRRLITRNAGPMEATYKCRI